MGVLFMRDEHALSQHTLYTTSHLAALQYLICRHNSCYSQLTRAKHPKYLILFWGHFQ